MSELAEFCTYCEVVWGRVATPGGSVDTLHDACPHQLAETLRDCIRAATGPSLGRTAGAEMDILLDELVRRCPPMKHEGEP